MTTGAFVIHEGKTLDINIGDVKKAIIEEHLGSGGFADAWKIKDLSTSKLYVLKHIRIKPDIVGEAKERLIQRIKNEASVNIPSDYITKSLGLNEFAKDNFGILFEFIPGKDFSAWILDNKTTVWEKKKGLFIKILKGINDAHRVNVIHRDLKPANILITLEEPKIIDFGLAKFKDKSVTITREFFGTLPYMDPNVLTKGIKYVDARCDIYAIGIILYEIVMGANPWVLNGLVFEELLSAIVTGKQNIFALDKAYNFKEDAIVTDIIARATTFNPENRIKTVNDIISMLVGKPLEKPEIKVDFVLTSPVLVVEDGSARGSMMNVLTIADGYEKQLGRMNLDATNDTISRKHAIIYREGNKYYLYDSNSKNGTFLNGSRIGVGKKNKIEIKHTDRIRFADLWTRFVFLKKVV